MLVSLSKIPASLGTGVGACLADTDFVKNFQLFKGETDNPFLAPRGVWVAGDKLFVSDTGQNRVFIWNKFPENEFQRADVVLGQNSKEDTGRNAGQEISASTLQYPSGLWSDGQKLLVADAWNHRVLLWNTIPTHDGQAADVVIGQPDFNQNQPNAKGIGSTPTAQSLNWCYGVFSDGKQLWIADTGNRRILYFEDIPTKNFAKADAVIGKPNFEERDYEEQDPVWPYSIRISPTGAMAVADTQFYRTLIWHEWRRAFDQKADVIIGQNDFEGCGMNQYNLSPRQNSLNWTYDAFFHKNGIFVADTGNSRVLWFENLPKNNAAEADNLIGHADFSTGSENSQTLLGTERQLYWPFSICVQANVLFLADTGNHRIVRYEV